MSVHKERVKQLWELLNGSEPFSQARIASSVYYKNNIVSVGFNRNKTHPLQKKFGRNEESIYLHAEIDAIIQARRYLTSDEIKSSIIYTARRKFTTHTDKEVWGLAKPCEGCMKAIKTFGFKAGYYSTERGKIEQMGRD